jgi:hypothetical protein
VHHATGGSNPSRDKTGNKVQLKEVGWNSKEVQQEQDCGGRTAKQAEESSQRECRELSSGQRTAGKPGGED